MKSCIYIYIWHIIYSSDPPIILLCVETGTGTGSKIIIVKLKFCAQPMHQIYVLIKYCILLKTIYHNKNELLGTSMAFHCDSFQVCKKSLPTKILSSFAQTAQLYQNIGNRRDQQINGTDKRAYSHIHPPSCQLIMGMAFQTWCICYKFSISFTNYGLKYNTKTCQQMVT